MNNRQQELPVGLNLSMSGSVDFNCRLSEEKLSYSLVERKTKVSECFNPANRLIGKQEDRI
jgi:hypothetical protein